MTNVLLHHTLWIQSHHQLWQVQQLLLHLERTPGDKGVQEAQRC